MHALRINKTTTNPSFHFEPETATFEVKGESRPEDPKAFFQPIFQWLEEYLSSLEHNKPEQTLVFKFHLEYLNSISQKYVYGILTLLDNYHSKGIPLEIEWNYDLGDRDMKEAGQEFKTMINVPVKIASVTI